MAHVLIAVGSCHRQAPHIFWATQWLSLLLKNCKVSRIIWTADIKGSGRMYMNRLVCGDTTLSATEMEALLKEAETRCGRSKEIITVDLDLMQYDGQRFHLKDWPRPYIQQLLNDVR